MSEDFLKNCDLNEIGASNAESLSVFCRGSFQTPRDIEAHGMKPMLRVVAYHSQLTTTDNLGAMMATLAEILKRGSLR